MALSPLTPSAPPAPRPARIRFTWSARARSFRCAIRGMGLLLRTQHNAWLHLAATAGVGAAGWRVGLTRFEWCAVVLAMALVWTAEALNTALEFLADEVSVAPRDLIGKAKDLGAGAVLLSSLGAAVVGVMVFLPHLLK